MPNIQVSRERARQIDEAHRQWLRSLPREPGQIGSTMGGLVQTTGREIPGMIQSYSDFPPVMFVDPPSDFIAYLRKIGVDFDEV